MYRTILRIIQWTEGYKKRLYIGFVCSFFTTICSAIPIMVAAISLDKIFADMKNEQSISPNMIWITLIIIGALVLLRYFFSYWRAKLQESIGYEIGAKQRIDIGNILKRVSLGYFGKNSIGDILSATTTELSILELQGMKMIDIVVNGYISVITTAIFLAFFCWQAALIVVIGVLISTLALNKISVRSRETAPISHKVTEKMADASIGYVRGIPIVKSYGQEGVSIKSIKDTCKQSKKINLKIERGFVSLNCLHLFTLKASSVALMFIAGWMTLNDQMDLSILIMAVMFSFTIFGSVEPINEASHILGIIESAMNKLDKINQAEYIDEGGKDIDIESYDIRFENVTFGYDEQEIIHDISFNLPQNTTTAIVGPSGSGKSTVCNLLARFYDVTSGNIYIGNNNIKEFTCNSLLKNISMVFQNVYLFHDSIHNNIRFGNPNASKEEIINAAKQACCHDFIMELPEGYDTVIGEGGSSLSGGEKQRISIARAILKNAPIVILDEATASVDPENEHLIQQAISALVHGKTIITIAHRLATIEQADQILVISDGRISQRGTHQQLIKQKGIYKDFINIRKQTENISIV
ncbi:ABC transporter ATP-binding protein [Vallitalea sediminicola]